jgi:hypothetical protein
LTPRPTHTVVNARGVAVSQHISEERAEKAARRRGPDYGVRPIGMRQPPEPARRPGAKPRAAEAATVRLEVRVTPAERDRYRAALVAGEDLSAVARQLLDSWAQQRGC